MFRAFLIAVGISMCIVGGECLVVDQAVFAYPNTGQGEQTTTSKITKNPFAKESYVTESKVKRREIKPPEWAPWGLLSGGVVVALYALTVQRES